jgi:hypothetical protein
MILVVNFQSLMHSFILPFAPYKQNDVLARFINAIAREQFFEAGFSQMTKERFTANLSVLPNH